MITAIKLLRREKFYAMKRLISEMPEKH